MRRSLFALGMLGVLPNVAMSQSRDSLKTPMDSVAAVGTPACCSIVRIEPSRSLVTARETATGFTFHFELKNRRRMASLKIGQPVWADFAAKTVKLKATDSTACCAIVETPPPPESTGGSSP
ncbi:MAG TPA: hypothetical protein VH762_01535 [Gemmatimonadaceae bacterium]|jgi:hypothetical protein